MEAFLHNFKPSISKSNDELIDDNIKREAKKQSMKPWVEKYRPQRIDEIVYQNEIISMLRKFLSNNSTDLPNLLFYGPSGTGKTSTIVALAKEMFGNLYKTRVLELNASDERGIAVIREKVKNFAQQTVSISKTMPSIKIIILDECDSMTRDAQSALRRTIEKESKTTRFCLICNYVSRIIEPLVSRCSAFRFRPLDTQLVINKLRQISDSESINISDEALSELVSLSEGDLRRAITLLQSSSLIKEVNQVLTLNDIHEVSGYIPKQYVSDFIDICQSKSYEKLSTFTANLISDGYSGTQFISQLHEWVIETDELLLSDNQKSIISEQIAVVDKRLLDGADEYLQILDIGSLILKTLSNQ